MTERLDDQGHGDKVGELVEALRAPFERYDSVQFDRCRELMERAADCLSARSAGTRPAADTSWFGAMETPFADVLRGHYLSHITCNEETHQDNPICACSAVNLGWHLSVGDAVEAWIAHVMVELGKLTPRSASELPAELFDGYAVWKALGDDSGVSQHSVAAVLDAVVRLIRAAGK